MTVTTPSTASTPVHIGKRTTSKVLGKRLHREMGRSFELSGFSEDATLEATNESSFYRNTEASAANSCCSSEKQAKKIILIRRKGSSVMRVDGPADVSGINLERNSSEVFEDSNNSLDYEGQLYEECTTKRQRIVSNRCELSTYTEPSSHNMLAQRDNLVHGSPDIKSTKVMEDTSSGAKRPKLLLPCSMWQSPTSMDVSSPVSSPIHAQSLQLESPGILAQKYDNSVDEIMGSSPQSETEQDDEEAELLAMEMRLTDFFDQEDIFVMGVSDSAPAFPNRKNVAPITSRRIRDEASKCEPTESPLDMKIKGSRLFSARKNMRRPPMLSFA